MEDANTLAQDRAGYRRLVRYIAFWVLVSFVLGFLFVLRNRDFEQRYQDHLIRDHSGKHQGV